jgi:hypothetical protein
VTCGPLPELAEQLRHELTEISLQSRTLRMTVEWRSSRIAPTDAEGRSMGQTDQAWDWGVELRDDERSELELLRRTVAQLRTQLDQAHDALRTCTRLHQDASQALRQLAEAKPWRRRRVRTALRERQLL